ncbi:hypothetical protein Q2T42_16005 [Leptolyngbya boryana CZ1]|uniref:WxL domain-containing protein n=1 Tax=Leptolyngbya boryana CZ1 TaxID=3060204 RepID=A0AA97ALH2_LEPBY|nr:MULTISPECIES: hypothetical protein [Leptolyngbya]MBN8564723.1 hypothetical protein [Leptolyngbya sp. UWPOB_LEPTO1]WNZ43357.1 hypothetical protein Q2T42_16005 [Leptolyngbya boryana CZ1]
MLNMNISRSILISGLLIGASVLFGSSAKADTTGTVPLSGTVNPTLALTATPNGTASALPLDGAAAGAEQIQKVAGLNVETNNTLGYTLTVSSGNLAEPKGDTIAYQVVVKDTATAAVSGDFQVASGTDYTYATTAANAAVDGNRDLYIRYTPRALQNPGAYTSTINLSVKDN